MKRKIIGALTVLLAAGVMASGALQADAMSIPTPPRPYTAVPAASDKVPAYEVLADGSIYQPQINKTTWNKLLAVPNGGVYHSSLNNGIVSEDKLAPAVRAKLNIGKLGGDFKILPTVIANIGGSWIARKTEITKFIMPAGTWLFNSDVTFDRLDVTDPAYLAPTTETMPQFALRYGINDKNTFGTSAGTVMGNPVSKAGYVELTGSSTKLATFTEPTEITAYGFGYNEDRSQFGGGQITVGGTVAVVRVK